MTVYKFISENRKEKSMVITDIKCATVEGFGGDWVLIKVLTDENITGYGETFPTWAHQGTAVRELVLWMKTLLVGEDPTNIDKLWHKMYQRQIYRGCSMAGALTTAISGIEIALWDISGKSCGLPVYKLLGGKHRDKIRVYSDYHGDDGGDPDAFAKRASELAEMGFTALKMDLDLTMWRDTQNFNEPMTQRELSHLTGLVKSVRTAIGPDIDLAVDCHSGFNAPAAVELAHALEPYHLLWLEEPIPAKNVASMGRIAKSTSTPICVGENLFTRYEFRELLEYGAADIIMPDIQKTGGILEGKRIADLASAYYIPFAPHCVVSPVGTMASVHLCASISNFLILEWHMIDVPWWEELALTDEPIVQNGYIKVPEKPGLGIELNEDAVGKYLICGKDFLD